jgi:predicted permease
MKNRSNYRQCKLTAAPGETQDPGEERSEDVQPVLRQFGGSVVPPLPLRISLLLIPQFLPSLLFSRVAASVTSTEALSRGLFVTAAHLTIVTIALILGQILVRICDPPAQFRNLFLVAIWNNNGTSLPTILVTAVILYAKDVFEGEDAAERGLSYIAFYALTYQLLAWTLGMHMITPKEGSVGSAQMKKSEAQADDSANVGVEEALRIAIDQKSLEGALSIQSGDGAAGATSGEDTPSTPSTPSSSTPSSSPVQQQQQQQQQQTSGTQTWCQFIRKKILVPPVCAVLAGLIVGLTPFLHDTLVVPTGAVLHAAMLPYCVLPVYSPLKVRCTSFLKESR